MRLRGGARQCRLLRLRALPFRLDLLVAVPGKKVASSTAYCVDQGDDLVHHNLANDELLGGGGERGGSPGRGGRCDEIVSAYGGLHGII